MTTTTFNSSATQQAVADVIRHEPGKFNDELAAILGWTQRSTNLAINALEAQGLVFSEFKLGTTSGAMSDKAWYWHEVKQHAIAA